MSSHGAGGGAVGVAVGVTVGVAAWGAMDVSPGMEARTSVLSLGTRVSAGWDWPRLTRGKGSKLVSKLVREGFKN